MKRKLIKAFGIIVITMMINIISISCINNANSETPVAEVQQKVTSSKIMKCLEKGRIGTNIPSSYVIMQDTKTSKRYLVTINVYGGIDIQHLD